MAATRGTLEHRVVRLSWGGALTIVATIVALIVLRRVFVAAHRPLSWALAHQGGALVVLGFAIAHWRAFAGEYPKPTAVEVRG